MPKKPASDESSSEDEAMNERLKEAVGTYQNSLKTEKQTQPNEANKKKSKRYEEKEEVDSDDFAPTPEFQDHVARKLKSKLEDSIELVEMPSDIAKKLESRKLKECPEQNFEIFRNIFINNNLKETLDNGKRDINSTNHKKKAESRKKRSIKKSESDDSESDSDLNKFKEAAVDLNTFNLY